MLSLVAAPERATTVQIRPFTDDLVSAVQDFNGRLAAGGVKYRFPDAPISKWLPKVDGRHLFQEYFLAVENGATVRGGYILKRQDFFIHGTRHNIAFYHLPLSEGLIDRKYGAIGLRLLTDALKREPALFVLGIGSRQEPLSRMLTAMSWPLHAVPFYFNIVRPFRVARKLAYLRTNAFRRVALDAGAFSGAAWLVSRLSAGRTGRWGRGVSATVQPRFGEWADTIWAECQERYSMIGERDRPALDILYPASDPRFIRIVVEARGVTIGWAVLLATDMHDDRYFGNLRVGSVVDCLAAPEQSGRVIASAVRCLRDHAVDLIVSNQMASAWVRGLEQNGFRAGPSTFLFGASKALRSLMRSDDALGGSHINRGDGDGPINL